MTINAEKLRSPHFVFILYMLAASLLIMVFRYILPGSEPPLLIFSHDWRLTRGILTLLDLFPALAFSALVIPFGIVSIEEYRTTFAEIFSKRLMVSIIVAICAAVIYCVIFFLVFPTVKGNEENMRFEGELYQLAKKNAQEQSRIGEWQEASKFVDICERIWPESPELDALRSLISLNLDERHSEETDEKSHARAALSREWRDAELSLLSGEKQPVDVTQAITLGQTAFNEKRYFDAHWLATLGMRLARAGGPEAANASRLASDAWNKIESQSPNRREEQRYRIYELKLSGYNAMQSSEWVRAYFIFLELTKLTPDDPDAINFLATSEYRAREIAFFIDEMEVSLGEILTGAVFSIPNQNGRAALRFSSLTEFDDFAYGMDLEYMQFDDHSHLLANVKARYAKLLPVNLNGKPQILVLTHALDRHNKNLSWDSEWMTGIKKPGGIILDISFEEFLLLSQVRRGLPNLQIFQLLDASNKLGSAGYVPQIFEAEILNRLGSAVFFLPMAIIVIVIGWRFRTKTKPRYLFALLLPVLPVVFHGFVFFYRSVLNTLAIWLVLSMGFSAALIVFIVALALSLFISLIVLAAQHS